MLDYVPGGLVAAAPGGGNWFHQHFSIGQRAAAGDQFLGRPERPLGHEEDQDKEEIPAWNIYGIEHGGRSINYKNEDPEVRRYYFERPARGGRRAGHARVDVRLRHGRRPKSESTRAARGVGPNGSLLFTRRTQARGVVRCCAGSKVQAASMLGNLVELGHRLQQRLDVAEG